jgi:hypothetical protein
MREKGKAGTGRRQLPAVELSGVSRRLLAVGKLMALAQLTPLIRYIRTVISLGAKRGIRFFIVAAMDGESRSFKAQAVRNDNPSCRGSWATRQYRKRSAANQVGIDS